MQICAILLITVQFASPPLQKNTIVIWVSIAKELVLKYEKSY